MTHADAALHRHRHRQPEREDPGTWRPFLQRPHGKACLPADGVSGCVGAARAVVAPVLAGSIPRTVPGVSPSGSSWTIDSGSGETRERRIVGLLALASEEISGDDDAGDVAAPPKPALPLSP